MIDHDRLRILVKELYATVSRLEDMFPGRRFTPDGHMVGSLGECLVAEAYNLDLKPASTHGHDAVTKQGLKVEIKATQSKTVAFRSSPEHVIVIKLLQDGRFDEFYNGPGHLIWDQFKGKPRPSNGQFQISLATLRRLNQLVPKLDSIPRVP